MISTIVLAIGIFEIHPIDRLGGIALFSSFIPIEGYKAKDAQAAFQAYESLPSQIKEENHDHRNGDGRV